MKFVRFALMVTYVLCECLIPIIVKQIIQVSDRSIKFAVISEPGVWVSILLKS